MWRRCQDCSEDPGDAQGCFPPKLWQHLQVIPKSFYTVAGRVILKAGPTLYLLLGHEDGWCEPNFGRESRILECSSVTGWFYSCGAYVNIIMLLKCFARQPWTSTSSSITVDTRLISQRSRLAPSGTDVSGLVRGNRRQFRFPFCILTEVIFKCSQTFLVLILCFLVINFFSPPLPFTAHHCSHLSPLSPSFTPSASQSLLSLSPPCAIHRF